MGVSCPYGVPLEFKRFIDNLWTAEMELLMVANDIPFDDAPETDLYDWYRQRIFDHLFGP